MTGSVPCVMRPVVSDGLDEQRLVPRGRRDTIVKRTTRAVKVYFLATSVCRDG